MGPGRRRRPAGPRAPRSLRRRAWRPGVARLRRGGRDHGGGGGGGAARTGSPERRGRCGAKLARRPGTSPAAAPGPGRRPGMGEHPSPGPAVAACAEAERIEELEPEAEERPPAEDVSAPSPAPANFLGGGGRGGDRCPRLAPRGVTGRFQGDAGAPRIGRVPAGWRGRREPVSPKRARAIPCSGSRGFPAERSARRCAGDPPATKPPPRGWFSARDTAFSRRGGRVTAVAPLPSHSRPAGSRSRGRSGRRRVPGSRRRRPPWRPLLRSLMSPGPAPALSKTLIEILAGPWPRARLEDPQEECQGAFAPRGGLRSPRPRRSQRRSPG